MRVKHKLELLCNSDPKGVLGDALRQPPDIYLDLLKHDGQNGYAVTQPARLPIISIYACRARTLRYQFSENA